MHINSTSFWQQKPSAASVLRREPLVYYTYKMLDTLADKLHPNADGTGSQSK